MSALKLIILATTLSACTCSGQKNPVSQNKNTPMIVEQFDTAVYQKTNNGFESYTREDGFEIYMMDHDQDGSMQKERFPKPSFYTISKEFYPNGNLKKKEQFIGEYVKTGVSQYYREDGSPERKNDEDKKFGNVKPEDILLFLQNKGVINLSNGDGRTDSEGRAAFELHFEERDGKKLWLVTIVKGKPNMSMPDKGEPPAFMPETYKIDGETGAEIK